MHVTRPRMPASYGVEPAQTDGMRDWSDVEPLLVAARNYWVCTAGPDHRPHATPVWGLWIDRRFFFSSDPQSRKARHLAASPDLVVHLESGDDVVIVEGSAAPVTAPEALQALNDAYEAKYHVRPEAIAGAVLYEVRPWLVSTWLEACFPTSATRFQIEAGQQAAVGREENRAP